MFNKKKDLYLKSFKSVTPDSLSRLSDLYKDSSSAFAKSPIPSIFPNKQKKTLKRLSLPFKPKEPQCQTPFVTSCNTQESRFYSTNTIKYSDFRDYHLNSTKTKEKNQNNGILSTEKPRKKSFFMKRRPSSDDKNKKSYTDFEPDNFLKKTVYSKPALTYADKLYRLNQISIFQ